MEPTGFGHTFHATLRLCQHFINVTFSLTCLQKKINIFWASHCDYQTTSFFVVLTLIGKEASAISCMKAK